jgi:hypothetical protein
VPDPGRLAPQERAYYHWLHGLVLATDGDGTAAAGELQRALEGGLRTENDQCLVHCLLAELALGQKRLPVAEQHLQAARALRHRPGVEPLLRQLEAQARGEPAEPTPASAPAGRGDELAAPGSTPDAGGEGPAE